MQVLVFCDFDWKTTIQAPFGGSWGHFSPKNVTHRLKAERTVIGRKHVIWAIKHEYRPRGSSWACEEKKDSTGQEKSHKRVIFHLFGEKPHGSDLHQKFCSRWPCRHNHVFQVSKWNFKRLRFYRWSNFPFSYWFLNGAYNSAALLRCLWNGRPATAMPVTDKAARNDEFYLLQTYLAAPASSS